MSDHTIALVKATVPALEQHGLTITGRMYDRMFRNEAIRELFNQSHHGEAGSQPKALAGAVLAYARNIDNLSGAVERIVHKHVALNILPEHYPIVANAYSAPSRMSSAPPQPMTSSPPGTTPTGSWPSC